MRRKLGRRDVRKDFERPPFRVAVKFRDEFFLPETGSVQEYLRGHGFELWARIEAGFAGASIYRTLTAIEPRRLRELVAQAARRDRAYRAPNHLNYCIVECRKESELDTIVKLLRSSRWVETAYVEPGGSEPSVNPVNDTRWPSQGYLDPAPDGIDAEYAWDFAGGDGAGQNFVDLERGWVLDHEELDAHHATLLHGSHNDDSRAHGTSVLGIVCARDNKVGGIGIVPNVGSVDVVSYHDSTRFDALMAAIDKLPFGGVLLIEAQIPQVTVGTKVWELMPIEVLDAEFDAIRLATALGITVVEAAGNNGVNLDTFRNAAGDYLLKRGGTGFRDSGAIMVGAATSIVPHRRIEDTNYGSRVDCYAWGEDVDTATSSFEPPFSTNGYTASFGLTSSASAIIAGAALSVQGIADALPEGFRFSALQMRSLLSNPAHGTKSGNPTTDRIGVMPSLRKIIDSDAIGLAPDVYVRDFVGDVGNAHSNTGSSSPDIILSPAAVASPQAAFGEGSGTENSMGLGAAGIAGQDNYVYVRVRNRGGSAATSVRAEVFWAPSSALATPDLWTLIGAVVIPSVPAGDVLTVSNPITWPAAALPASGSYTLIAIVSTAKDPAPPLTDFEDWDTFVDFVQNNNGVARRSMNVVPVRKALRVGLSGFTPLDFLAAGPLDRGRRMDLEVVARLPAGSRLLLEMPTAFYDSLRERPPTKRPRDDRVRVPMNPHGARLLGDLLFTAKSRTQLRLLAHVPARARIAPYELYVRKLYNGAEVGRMTWRLAPPERGQHRATPKSRRGKSKR